MDDKELASTIRRKLNNAINSPDSEVSDVRKETLARYRMEHWGDETEGRSQFVTSEVFESVEWFLSQAVRVFLSGNFVNFEPESPEDEAAAATQSNIINALIKQNPTYWGALYDGIKDACLNPNSYVKVYMATESQHTVQPYVGLTYEDIDTLEASYNEGDEVRITDMDKYLQDGKELYKFTLHCIKEPKPRLMIECIPPEQVYVDSSHKDISLDTCPFVAHKTSKSKSDLLEMGFTNGQLDGISANSSDNFYNSDETISRNDYVDERSGFVEDPTDGSQQRYDYIEAYIKYDVRGNGRAELRKVILVGDKILANDPIEEQPFATGTCIRMTHTHIGMGIAETLLTTQFLSSFVTRQMLDNLYEFCTGRKYVSAQALVPGGATVNQLQNRGSEYVLVEGNPAAAVVRDPVNPVLQTVQPLLDSIKRGAERRSGVAFGSSLDPDVLQKATATNALNAGEQLSARVELYVQTLAETLFKEVFLKAHRLLRSYVDDQRNIKVGGKWAQYNPSKWEPRDTVTVNTGLGLGNKQERMQLGLQLLGMQKEMMAMGLATPTGIYNTLSLLIDSFDIGSASQYFVDPESPEYRPPQPPPDPQMELAKAEQTKAQAQVQQAQAKAQTEMANVQVEQAKSQSEMQIKQTELQIQQVRLQAELARLAADTDKTKVETALNALKMQHEVRMDTAQMLNEAKRVESTEKTE